MSITTTLQSEPPASYTSQKFSIKTSTNQRISVNAQPAPVYHYGQIVTVQGRLTAHTFPDGLTIFSLYHPQITLEKDANNPIAAVANAIRSHTRSMYQAVLPQTSASLLMGMVFGANEQFPGDFRQALQTTGVLHVIAASGMNVTFVSAALLYTLVYFSEDELLLSSVLPVLSFIFFWWVFSRQFCGQALWEFLRLAQEFSEDKTLPYLPYLSVDICYCCGSRIFSSMLVFNFHLWQLLVLCFSNRF